jgi:hypothetical protein
MYAFNTKEKALEYLAGFIGMNTVWTAKLSIGSSVGHSSINLYANGNFVGSLQGNILGAALYKDKNANGLEGGDINLTWQKVHDGTEEAYAHPTAWGTWFCHDITAAIFRRWGMSGQDVYRAAYPSTPGGRIGLVSARIVALLAVPGTEVMLGVHEAWNRFQDAWNGLRGN